MQNRQLQRALIVAAFFWHFLAVFGDGWVVAEKARNTRDFGSYYYALEVARDGGNPYVVNATNGLDKLVRRNVHPYFYPPPALLAMTWISEDLPVKRAYLYWFWLAELALLAASMSLWRWFKPLSPMAGPTIVFALAVLSSIADNHLMGQVNTTVLMFVIGGLSLTDPLRGEASRKREFIGGVLVGLGAMLKMSPAIFLLWWALQRRWRPVIGAIFAALGSSLLALPLVGLEHQIYFYQHVLPGFGSGVYNGLTVSIGLFGNHSIPNLFDMLAPNNAEGLSTVARLLSGATALGLIGLLGLLFRSRTELSAWQRAGQICAVTTLLLLIPIYTYEHHLVWALPAGVLCALGVFHGKLPRWMSPLVGLAWFGWAFKLSTIKQASHSMQDAGWVVAAGALQEIKFFALVIFLVASVIMGLSRFTVDEKEA
jgi:hypothetical protein